MEEQRKLYALARGEGRCNAQTLCRAACQLGIYAYVKRADGGYSTRVGAQSKQPDRIWIEHGGDNYGSGLSNRFGEPMGLVQFAEMVVESITDEQRKFLEIDYHIQHLKRLGVEVNRGAEA